jgi:hypothetical protein
MSRSKAPQPRPLPGVLLGLLIAQATFGSSPAPAGVAGVATGEPIPISSCGPITATGRYLLTRDLQAAEGSDCIRILAEAVELDLGGFEIRGNHGPAAAGVNGISAEASGASVHNGRVTGFAVGVVLQSGLVHGLRVSGVDHGIYVGSGAVLGNAISATHTGVAVHDARVIANEVDSAATAIHCGLRCVAERNLLTESVDWADDSRT